MGVGVHVGVHVVYACDYIIHKYYSCNKTYITIAWPSMDGKAVSTLSELDWVLSVYVRLHYDTIHVYFDPQNIYDICIHIEPNIVDIWT